MDRINAVETRAQAGGYGLGSGALPLDRRPVQIACRIGMEGVETDSYFVKTKCSGVTVARKRVAVFLLASGDEKWSQPGFGVGQVLLVDGHLLAQDDDGALVLIRPNPAAYTQVARFQAVNSKSWNAPAVSNGRIYARSVKEGICLDVSPPPPLRLNAAIRKLDGSFQFRVTSSDGGSVGSDRLNRIEVLTASSLTETPINWIKVTSAVISADGTAAVRADDGSEERFFTVRELE